MSELLSKGKGLLGLSKNKERKARQYEYGSDPFQDFVIIREHTLVSRKEDEKIRILSLKPQFIMNVMVSVFSGESSY